MPPDFEAQDYSSFLQGSHLADLSLQSHLTLKMYASACYKQGVNFIRLWLPPTGCGLQTVSLGTLSLPTWRDFCSVNFNWGPRPTDTPVGGLRCII